MSARVYQPARSAMQSGQAKTRNWVLEFIPAQVRTLDPLMGWTGSGDMNSQVRLTFESKEAALAYAERHHIPVQTAEPKKRAHILRANGYGDNFSSARRNAWTH